MFKNLFQSQLLLNIFDQLKKLFCWQTVLFQGYINKKIREIETDVVAVTSNLQVNKIYSMYPIKYNASLYNLLCLKS